MCIKKARTCGAEAGRVGAGLLCGLFTEWSTPVLPDLGFDASSKFFLIASVHVLNKRNGRKA